MQCGGGGGKKQKTRKKDKNITCMQACKASHSTAGRYSLRAAPVGYGANEVEGNGQEAEWQSGRQATRQQGNQAGGAKKPSKGKEKEKGDERKEGKRG